METIILAIEKLKRPWQPRCQPVREDGQQDGGEDEKYWSVLAETHFRWYREEVEQKFKVIFGQIWYFQEQIWNCGGLQSNADIEFQIKRKCLLYTDISAWLKIQCFWILRNLFLDWKEEEARRHLWPDFANPSNSWSNSISHGKAWIWLEFSIVNFIFLKDLSLVIKWMWWSHRRFIFLRVNF